jgi:hypothetical protein
MSKENIDDYMKNEYMALICDAVYLGPERLSLIII